MGRPQVRYFGAAGHHHHQKLKFDYKNTDLEIPTEHDVDHHMAKTYTYNDKFLGWVNTWWAVDVNVDRLTNDSLKKVSLCNLLTRSAFHNKLTLNVIRFITGDNSPAGVTDLFNQPWAPPGSKWYNDIKQDYDKRGKQLDINVESEILDYPKTLPLYHSHGASRAVFGSRAYVWVTGGLWATYLMVPGWNMLLLPALVQLCFLPNHLSMFTYVCWHARLLAEQEEVWFYKVNAFGQTRIHRVKTSELEKVDDTSDLVNPILWLRSRWDENMVFRDKASGQVFVFDRYASWNEDTLKHPLLY
jgi:hypothetical protein